MHWRKADNMKNRLKQKENKYTEEKSQDSYIQKYKRRQKMKQKQFLKNTNTRYIYIHTYVFI